MKLSKENIWLRQIIIDHYTNPHNKTEKYNLKDYKKYYVKSNTCIDEVTIFVRRIKNKITNIKFNAIGCAICIASTDITCDFINTSSNEYSKKAIDNYLLMILNKKHSIDMLGEYIAFQNIKNLSSRINCAKIGVELIMNSIFL